MLNLPASIGIFVARDAVDFRKAHDGLLAVIRDAFGDDPFDGSARRKSKHRSRTTRDPPARSCPLRATPSTRPQPPARTDPRPHAAAFPPREHTAPPPRPPSDRNFAPHRHSAASPSSAASLCAAGGARHPDGSAPAAVSPSAASTRAIAAGSWIAASTRRGPAHFGQTSSGWSALGSGIGPYAGATGAFAAASVGNGDVFVGGYFQTAGALTLPWLAQLTTTCPARAEHFGAGC